MVEDFPERPKSSLTKEAVVGYLAELKAKGWPVYRASQGDSFEIDLDEFNVLTIRPGHNACDIGGYTKGGRTLVGRRADNLLALKQAVESRLATRSPTSIRTRQGQTASNYVAIAGMIGTSKVEAVHDRYLDDRALRNLLALLGLANGASTNLRLLTGPEGAGRLHANFVDAFFKELGCTSGQARKTTTSTKQHQRFMLLSGGQSLIVGMSFNDLDKNEAVHLDSDTDDKKLFDDEWSKSLPL